MPSTSSLDLARMRKSAQSACQLLKMLSNANRLMLVCQIAQGEVCVGDLETLLDIGQPTLSQQLGALRRAGIVSTRRDGKNIYYSIADARALALIDTLYAQYCQPGATPARASRKKKA